MTSAATTPVKVARMGRQLVVVVAAALCSAAPDAAANHLSRADVEALVAQCEAAREAKLAPMRERAVEECVARGARDAAGCRRFYRDLGDATANRPRLFHDLAQCRAADEAARHHRLYPP